MGKKDWFINEETRAMLDKVKKINEEIMFSWGREKLDNATLEEFGNWLYKYRDVREKASAIIDMMLYTSLDEYEYFVVWESFNKNIDTDFSELIELLLRILNSQLKEEHAFCTNIVWEYVNDESDRTESLNFKRRVKSDVAPNVISIAKNIVKKKIEASEDIIIQCKQLLKFNNILSVDDSYIAFLIGESDVFLDTIATIRDNY